MELEIRPSKYPVEFQRSEESESEGVITGYIAKYDEETTFMGRKEVVDKGAFNRFLESKRMIPALYDHDSKNELAHMDNGDVRLWDDGIGLMYRIKTGAGAYWDAIKRGVVKGCSFAFDPDRSRVIIDSEGRRHLNDLWLDEVTITPKPAYRQTSVTARAEAEFDQRMAQQEIHQQEALAIRQRTILAAYDRMA